jgi:hypothetical protein
MRIKKVDANQKEIVEGLRKYPGISVAHTHILGDGFPDIVVGCRGVNYLFEIKDGSKPPSARKLTEDETLWHGRWGGQVNIVMNLEDILAVMKYPIDRNN